MFCFGSNGSEGTRDASQEMLVGSAVDADGDGLVSKEEYERFKTDGQDLHKSTSPDHELIVQGARDPMAIGEMNALHVFDMTDCPGSVTNLDDIIIKPSIGASAPNSKEEKKQTSQKDVPAQSLADQIVQKVNGKRSAPAWRLGRGRMVHEGYFQFIEHSGRTSAVGAGKWTLAVGRWGKTAHVSEKLISSGNVTIAWVQRSQLGLGWLSGREVLLDAGIHVYNNPGFTFDRAIDKDVDYIQHGTFHIVRVPRGKFAKVWISTSTGGKQPRLLTEGLHCADCSFFTYEGMCSILTEKHIVHGTHQLLRVPSGHVAKITHDSQPQLLGPGFHFYEGMMVQYLGLVPISDKVITHGKITIVRVSTGEVVLAWLHNEPLFLEDPGTYGFADPKFVYVQHVPSREKIVALGEKKVVKVRDGEVAISHQHGKLRFLQPGRHILDDPTQTVSGFLPKEEANKLVRGIHSAQPYLSFGCHPLPYKYVDGIQLEGGVSARSLQ